MDDLTSRLPEQLSPSRASDFLQCPRLFYYKTIEKRPTPATTATTKGTLAHYALEQIFDFPRDERIPALATPFVRAHWAEISGERVYEPIVALPPKEIEAMLVDAERLVTNWFSIERANNFDPVGRELKVAGAIGGCRMRGIIDRVDVVELQGKEAVYISDYKGLALTTPLPTPTGWTTMGEVQEGEYLLGSDGQASRVTVKSEVHTRACYEVSFDDGTSIVCDNVHLWELDGIGIVNGDELFNLWEKGADLYIKTARALDRRPVVLGDARLLGWRIRGGDIPVERADGVRRASAGQRVELLTGLLTDGHLGSGTYAIPAHACELVGDVLAGLGLRFLCTRVSLDSCVVTLLKGLHHIVNVACTSSVATQCVQVDSPDNLYLAGSSMIPTHNSGNLPKPAYSQNIFFAMDIYTELLEQQEGLTAGTLRLVYLKNGRREDVKRRGISDESRGAIVEKVTNLYEDMTSCATKNDFPPRTSPLCNYCHFQSICPAWTTHEDPF